MQSVYRFTHPPFNKKNENSPGKDSPWLDVNDIKQRVSVEMVLSRYGILGALKRKGPRLSGRSPFREEQKASFFVDTEKGIWNDFGGRPEIDGREVPGNVIGLVQALEVCSFREALLTINRDFIESQSQQDSKSTGDQEKPSDPQPMDESPKNSDAEKTLPTTNAPFGKELGGLRFDVPYLLNKGITEETAKAFGVGYCSRGLMKSRVVFPVRNRNGAIMAYAGRSLKEGADDKYRFPAGFNKSLELFNIDRIANDAEAKKATRDFGIILVEGFTDAMKLSQEGFPNVVALMGTDFHEAQKNLLLDPDINPTRRLTLFLDDNEAGHRGKRKIAQQCIHDAFIRYVDYTRAGDAAKTEPEHFIKDEFTAILGFHLSH